MLDSLGISMVTLLTNNPNKIDQLRSYGIDVVNREPLIVGVGESNRAYLETKADRMGHSIDKNVLEDYWGRGRELNPGWGNHNPPC